MEWENWLDKKVLDHGKQRKTDDFADPDKSLLLDTEPDKTIPQIKRDFDDETHEDPFSNKNDVNKILGALVGGAAKVVGEAAGKVGGAIKDVASSPVVQSAVSNTGDKVDNVVEDVKNESQTGVSKAWESWLEKNDDEYHSVMNDVTNERKGSKYDKNTKQWTNPVGMPSRQHCGATSTSLANRGHGKKVSGKYHGTWDGKPEDHSWVENKDGHIIDASRDQFHGVKEQGIKTIKQDHPDYSKYKKNPNCPSCGTDKPPTKFTNLRSRCTGDNCNHFGDDAPEIFEKHHGRKHRDNKELGTFRKEAESQSNALHGIGKSWESWLEKNNGIETDHKKEDKHEWDGKFSSSTIRDDAENDDDKAVSEEESLEELTDGKLEEVEKLKSWEVFLKGGFGGVENQVGESYASEEEANRKPDMQKRNPKKRIKGKNVGAAKKKLVGIRADGSKIHEIVPNEVKINPSPTDHSDKTGAFQETAGTKNMTGGDHKAVAERVVAKNPEYAKFMSDVAPKEALGTTTNERVPTAEEYDAKFNERVQPEKNTTRKRVSSAALAARRASMKSWEAWLEKTTKEPNVGTRNGIPHPAARTAKEIEASAQQAASTGDVDIGTLTPDMKKKKSWEEWVEKMQGAGDARYGNQHLTGMEQHPVADDESMELSAETEENNEKQEKKEDKGDKDNKPYKALSQE